MSSINSLGKKLKYNVNMMGKYFKKYRDKLEPDDREKFEVGYLKTVNYVEGKKYAAFDVTKFGKEIRELLKEL